MKRFIFSQTQLLFLFFGLFAIFSLDVKAQSNDSTQLFDFSESLNATGDVLDIGIEKPGYFDTALIKYINGWLGVRYCYGAASKAGTDCSGFITSVYRDVYKISLPRSSPSIYQKCEHVDRASLNSGDLVFFAIRGGKQVSHVGVYLWDGYFVHASTKRGVIISNLSEDYYNRYFAGGGYVIQTMD